MTGREGYAEDDPRRHAIKIKGMLTDALDHYREDAGKIGVPRDRALFETTAEVLSGLVEAQKDHESRSGRLGASEADRPGRRSYLFPGANRASADVSRRAPRRLSY